MFDYLAISAFLTAYAIKIGTALVVLIIGWYFIKYLLRLVDKVLDKKDIAVSLHSIIITFSGISLKIMLLISVASMAGVEVTSFLALLGTAGLAIGLALQGSLANVAGGMLILFLKPFKEGDYIEAGSWGGTVKETNLFFTVLTTADNKLIHIPNGPLANMTTINHSASDIRRLDINVSIEYGEDFFRVKQLLLNLLMEHELILKEPLPQVIINNYAESAVEIAVRSWVKREDYWTANFDLKERIKALFDENGITIPYPHMEVVLKKVE